MREILFRGKTKRGKWVEGLLGCNYFRPNEKYYYIHNCETDDIEHEVIPETIEQFTGLTDKNEKKIFEGDIVKVFYIEKRDYHGVKYDDEFEMIEMVVYNENSACFMLEIDNEGITMFRPLHDFGNNVFIKSIEVIGNIHDNPELLGE